MIWIGTLPSMCQEIKCSMLLSLTVQICLLSSVEFLCLAWRNELVVYLSFSSIYTTLYFYVLSTVLRKSSFTLYTRSKFSLVEHSTIIRNGKIQHQLLNQEYSFTITQRLPSTTHRKDRADGECAGKPTSFSIPTRPRFQRKLTASNQPRTYLPLKN